MVTDIFAPLIQQGLTILIQLVVLAAIGSVATLKPHVKAFIEAHTSAKNAALIETYAGQAFAYAEDQFTGANGEVKMRNAITFATNALAKRGVKVDPQEVQAAIQKAWFDANNVTIKSDPEK